ncbi:MAG: hypothetical protein U0X91_19835 [Spirosomataceae bacterium]
MKTLSGVLLLSLTALCTCSDTQAGISREENAFHYCQVAESRCLKTPSAAVSFKEIPPVGCAIPMAQLEKAWQAR